MPVSASTCSESSLLVGSMMCASTSCRNTASPSVASSNPSASQARLNASHSGPIREETICNGPDPTASPWPCPGRG